MGQIKIRTLNKGKLPGISSALSMGDQTLSMCLMAHRSEPTARAAAFAARLKRTLPSGMTGAVRPCPSPIVACCASLLLAALSSSAHAAIVQDARPVPSGPAAFASTIEAEAALAHLPVQLVKAVIKVESDFQPDRIGRLGEVGLMQVLPSTAAQLGFTGTPADLMVSTVNIHYGATYLGRAWRLANGDVCRALMKYRAGHGSEIMTPLSVTYCQRAQAYLADLGSPLAATASGSLATYPGLAPQPSLLPRADLPLPRSLKNKRGAAFWAIFEARIRRINAAVESKWRRTARR